MKTLRKAFRESAKYEWTNRIDVKCALEIYGNEDKGLAERSPEGFAVKTELSALCELIKIFCGKVYALPEVLINQADGENNIRNKLNVLILPSSLKCWTIYATYWKRNRNPTYQFSIVFCTKECEGRWDMVESARRSRDVLWAFDKSKLARGEK